MYRNKNKAKARSLHFVNRLRVTLGKKPLKSLRKGYCIRPEACALAQSIVTCVNRQVMVLGSEITLRFETYTQAENAAAKMKKAGFEATTCAGEVTIHGPEYLDEFVHAFDDRQYPELIAA